MESYPTHYTFRDTSLPIPRPSRPLKESVKTSTLIYEADSGHTQRRIKAPPRKIFDIQYNVLPQACYETIRNFYIAKAGQVQAFRWIHPVNKTGYTVRFDQEVLQGEPLGFHDKFGELYKLSFRLIEEF